MDSLAPPLRALLNIKLKIRTGISIREAIKEYGQEACDCDFAKNLSLWLFHKESEQEQKIQFTHNYRKLLVEVLERGLQGEQILDALDTLEEEVINASNHDLETQLQKLPFIVFIPLFFLQLPALLLLIFYPLVSKLLYVF